ncbi:protein kinase-like domain-containing protein [Artemisia annua]|uniref:Protein kinase-like domain-containing protein n=1 Tax=Artemisia annua TaxID=35608 RepID=A0A2U1N6K2_ARTAN|nr:protein kinase-like domain-containing protein [Artemisia annua]
MKIFQAYHFLQLVIFLSLTAATSVAAQKYAKPGCKDTCRNNVVIPYPFGIGENCSVNKWYTVECNASKPYLSALNHLEVVGVDLVNQTVTVNIMQKISDCSRTQSVDLGRTPFLYSRSQNKFVVQGCGHAVLMDDHGSVLTGCSSTCSNDATTVTDINKCFGIGCCEATITHYIKSYNMNLTGLESLGGDGPCGFAHLVDKNYSYVEGRSSSSHVKTSLLWTLSDHDFDQITCDYTSKARLLVDLGNGTSISSWKCSSYSYYKPIQGNPYLIGGMDGMQCYIN